MEFSDSNEKANGSVKVPELATSPVDVSSDPTTTTKTSTSLSSLPTKEDLLLAAIYPTTLVFASLFANISRDPSASASYFSQKGNLFNTFFVKYGWLWTSLVFFLHLSRLRTSSRPKAALRWGLATIWWIVVTQWFFGAPLMDRTFLLTGGICEPAALEEMGVAKTVFTSAACKVTGGTWSGGHDLSGHVFLLTHASLFLASELLPTLKSGFSTSYEDLAMYAILGMWWWMLLMTGIYFHTWVEKLTGWIAAMVQWGAIYAFALRALPEVRVLLGIPGI